MFAKIVVVVAVVVIVVAAAAAGALGVAVVVVVVVVCSHWATGYQYCQCRLFDCRLSRPGFCAKVATRP